MREKKWWGNTVPSCSWGRREVLAHLLALVQAGRGVRELTFGAVWQRAEWNGRRAAVRGEACGALNLACRDGGGGDASGQGDGSDDGDDGFLEEHCLRK